MTADETDPAAANSEANAATLSFGRLSVGAILGPVLLIAAAIALFANHLQSDPNVQVCDGKQMGPGDTCVRFSTGEASSYEEMVSEAVGRWWVTPAMCAGLIAIALVFVVVALAKWMRDRKLCAGLDLGSVVLGASSPVRVSVIGVIGMSLFLAVATFSASNFIADGLSWYVLIPIVFAILGLVNFAVAFPVHGNLLAVNTDGQATVVTGGKARQVAWQELTLFRSGKPNTDPELRLGAETVLELPSYLVGRDAVVATFARTGPGGGSVPG